MAHRFGYYMIHSYIDDVWNKTLSFCQNHKCKIINQFISENRLYRELKIKHGASMHPYATSMGETYKMTFGYHPKESITYISVEIKFSMFGKGFPLLVPKNIMKRWAKEIGTRPMKLTREQDQTYLEKFDQICNISGKEIPHTLTNFCPICGHRNTLNTELCIVCCTNLKD